MKFDTVLSRRTFEAFIEHGDLTSAHERLIEARRRAGNSSDYATLAEAIVAFAGRRASRD